MSHEVEDQDVLGVVNPEKNPIITTSKLPKTFKIPRQAPQSLAMRVRITGSLANFLVDPFLDALIKLPKISAVPQFGDSLSFLTRHSREGGNPFRRPEHHSGTDTRRPLLLAWIPAFAGMTAAKARKYQTETLPKSRSKVPDAAMP